MNLINKLHGLWSILKFDNWLQLVMERALFHPSLSVYEFKGMQILIDHDGGEAPGTRACLASNMYRDLLCALPRNAPINVIDLGANGGGFAMLLAAEGFSIRKLLAVEMHPRTFQQLQFNVRRNIAGEVVLRNCAVGGSRRQIRLALGAGSTGASIRANMATQDESTTECVDVETMDAICGDFFAAQGVDICKMDIEGAEYEVLAHPGRETLRTCKWLIMEIHRAAGLDKPALQQQIADIGFVPVRHSNDGDVVLFENRRVSSAAP